MATYVIGDLQGCLRPLKTLLRSIDFHWDRDRLWLVGDLVNRGPDSLTTLRFLYERRANITAVLGNHDLHLLAVARTGRKSAKGDTLGSILKAPDRELLLDWLRHLPLAHYDAQFNTLMVHAGVSPTWTLEDALSLSNEVSWILQNHPQRFLENMYGNEPARWQSILEGMDRLRAITNFFTRLRFCRPDGTMEFKSKGTLTDPPEGFLPWFQVAGRHTATVPIVFGHWAALQGIAPGENITALDTGCVWGGKLTAYCLEDQRFVNCDC